MSNVVTTDLLTRLTEKSLTGGAVTVSDLIETIELINRNSIASEKLSQKVDALIKQTGLGFHAINESLDSHDVCIESLVDLTETIVDNVALIDRDVDGIYKDMNGIIEGEIVASESLMLCRYSDPDLIEDDEDDFSDCDTDEIIGFDTSQIQETQFTIHNNEVGDVYVFNFA